MLHEVFLYILIQLKSTNGVLKAVCYLNNVHPYIVTFSVNANVVLLCNTIAVVKQNNMYALSCKRGFPIGLKHL